MYESRVERQIEAAHHNGPPDSRCYTNHGHSWKVIVVFRFRNAFVKASPFGWGPDFGKIKRIIDQFDHKDLNQMLGVPPSAENFARVLFDQLCTQLGFIPEYVELHEGGGNSVRYFGEDNSQSAI